MSSGRLLRKATKAAMLPIGLPGRSRRGDVVILLYHRVGEGPSEIDLPVDAFESQLEFLARRRRAIALQDALKGEEGIVVTFDDGFRDFYDSALPLLVRYSIPAVLYLATGFVENGSPAAPTEGLSWSQLNEAIDTGLVTVGAHTHSHADLSAATRGEAYGEMKRSKEMIEDRLGVACKHFAYPWAVASPGADEAARELFESAALDAWRTNRRGRTDPHRLGRTPILASDGPVFFRAKAAGALDSEALIYRVLRRGPWRASRGVMSDAGAP